MGQSFSNDNTRKPSGSPRKSRYRIPNELEALEPEALLSVFLRSVRGIQAQIHQPKAGSVAIFVSHIGYNPAKPVPPIHKVPAHFSPVLPPLFVMPVEPDGVVELVEQILNVRWGYSKRKTLNHVRVLVFDRNRVVSRNVDEAVGYCNFRQVLPLSFRSGSGLRDLEGVGGLLGESVLLGVDPYSSKHVVEVVRSVRRINWSSRLVLLVLLRLVLVLINLSLRLVIRYAGALVECVNWSLWLVLLVLVRLILVLSKLGLGLIVRLPLLVLVRLILVLINLCLRLVIRYAGVLVVCVNWSLRLELLVLIRLIILRLRLLLKVR